jgi:hypothetical protein
VSERFLSISSRGSATHVLLMLLMIMTELKAEAFLQVEAPDFPGVCKMKALHCVGMSRRVGMVSCS